MTSQWIYLNGELISLGATVVKRIAPDGSGNVIFYYPNGSTKSYAFGSVDVANSKMALLVTSLGAQDTTLPAIGSLSPTSTPSGSIGSLTILFSGINLVSAGALINNPALTVGSSSNTMVNSNLITVTWVSFSAPPGLTVDIDFPSFGITLSNAFTFV